MVRRASAVVVVALLAANSVAAAISDGVDSLNKAPDSDDYLVKQVMWKKCHRKLSPACLKLSLVRTVEMMSKDSSYFLAPGVFFSSNLSDSSPMPADLARSLSQEHAHLDDLVSFAVSRFMRSLTLNVNLVDFFSGGNETVQHSMIDAMSGRAKGGGLGGYGGIALVMGGSLASMMLAGLAALAGKALMTSMLALMMAALSAMKGSGGGGGGEHKTYEVITKPIVSHVNTHSSEVQHEHGGHHHYGRSLDVGVVAAGVEAEPYKVYAQERHYGKSLAAGVEAEPYKVYAQERHYGKSLDKGVITEEVEAEPFKVYAQERQMRSVNTDDVGSDPFKIFKVEEQRSLRLPNLKAIAEEGTPESREMHVEENQRTKRSLVDDNVVLTRKDIDEILRDLQRNKRNIHEQNDQEKSSSEVHYAYSKFSEKDKLTANGQEHSSEPHKEVSQRNERSIKGTIDRTELSAEDDIYNAHQLDRQEIVRRRSNPDVVIKNPKKESYESRVHFPTKEQYLQREKRKAHNSHKTNPHLAPVEENPKYFKPPFKYIPTNPNSRIKRNIIHADLPDSKIYHIYQNPYEYVSSNFPVRHQFAIDNRRYKRNAEERLIMPLALVG